MKITVLQSGWNGLKRNMVLSLLTWPDNFVVETRMEICAWRFTRGRHFFKKVEALQAAGMQIDFFPVLLESSPSYLKIWPEIESKDFYHFRTVSAIFGRLGFCYC